jgi:hypothetical protein
MKADRDGCIDEPGKVTRKICSRLLMDRLNNLKAMAWVNSFER